MLLCKRISAGRLEQAGVLAAMAVYAVMVLAHADFVPIWDGLTYSRDCVLRAVSEPFSLMGFNCFRHPTMAYVLLVALPQYLDPGNTALLHATNMALGLGSIAALHFIVRKLFSGEELWPERVLVTLVYAGFPLLIANTLNMNPDFGMLVFFLLTLALLLHGRVALTAAAGVFLVFCKEPGVLLYLCIVCLYVVFHVTRSEASGRAKLRELGRLWPLLLPVVSIAVFYLYRASQAGPMLWAVGDSARDRNILRSFTSFSLLNPTFLSYARGIFLINFNWFLSLFVVGLAVVRGAQLLLVLPRPRPWHGRRRDLGLVLTLFVVVFVLLTRFPTFTNLRYLLPVYPLLIVVFYHSLCVLTRERRLRVAVLGTAFVLTFVSNFGTIDPVSRFIYGTFNFGTREMLRLTSVTNECCGHGRDQLVYNLQFTKFHDAVNHIFQTLRPTADTVLLAHSGFRNVMTPQADFMVVGTIDKQTFGRTLSKERDAGLRTKTLRELWRQKKKPPVAFYIDLPNYDSTVELQVALRRYRVEWVRWFGDPGHILRVYKLVLK